MKFTLCLLAIASAAMGLTIQEHNANIAKRQNTQDNIPVNVAAMSDKGGNVVQFDSKNVYMAMKEAGL